MQAFPGSHPLYSPDLTPASLLLSSTLKKEVAVLTLSLDKFKTNWEGVIRTLTEDKFARVPEVA